MYMVIYRATRVPHRPSAINDDHKLMGHVTFMLVYQMCIYMYNNIGHGSICVIIDHVLSTKFQISAPIRMGDIINHNVKVAISKTKTSAI